MRKVLPYALAAFLVAAGIPTAIAADGLTGKVIRVGTMANALGLPLVRAREAGYFKDAGVNVDIVVFATGAPINEAMAADELDVAVSGMASVYALATGRYKYVGDGAIAVSGEGIFARPGSPVTQTHGKVPGTLGDAKTLKGINILGPLATSSHYAAIKYIESVGLTSDDFNMVSMEHPQAYQAFLVGQGDLIASNMPYSAKLEEEGYVMVADLKDLTGGGWQDTVYAQSAMVENRRADLLALLDCYYRACEDLTRDEPMRRELGLRWYAEEGKKYSAFDMDTEVEQKAYHSFRSILSEQYPFGETMKELGGFFTNQGMIDEDNLPNIEASLEPSLVQELKAKYVK